MIALGGWNYFKVETNDSAIALSSAVPVLPIDGAIPTSLSFCEKESAVCRIPLVEVMDEPGGRLPSPHVHPEGAHDDLGSQVALHRPSNDPTRVDVEDEGQVQEAFIRRDVCDVRDSHLVFARGLEVPFHEIFRRLGPLAAAGGRMSFPRMQPRRAVGLPAAPVYLFNPPGEGSVPEAPFGKLPSPPVVVAAP